jgi:hypothetical protein
MLFFTFNEQANLVNLSMENKHEKFQFACKQLKFKVRCYMIFSFSHPLLHTRHTSLKNYVAMT